MALARERTTCCGVEHAVLNASTEMFSALSSSDSPPSAAVARALSSCMTTDGAAFTTSASNSSSAPDVTPASLRWMNAAWRAYGTVCWTSSFTGSHTARPRVMLRSRNTFCMFCVSVVAVLVAFRRAISRSSLIVLSISLAYCLNASSTSPRTPLMWFAAVWRFKSSAPSLAALCSWHERYCVISVR